MTSLPRDRIRINGIADEPRPRQLSIQKNMDYGFVFSDDIEDWRYCPWRKQVILRERKKKKEHGDK